MAITEYDKYTIINTSSGVITFGDYSLRKGKRISLTISELEDQSNTQRDLAGLIDAELVLVRDESASTVTADSILNKKFPTENAGGGGGGGGSGVTTFNSRSGAVVPAAGDYAASQVAVVPTGNITSTTAQAALAELDTLKVSGSTTVSATAPVAASGDLSSLTLSLDVASLTDLGATPDAADAFLLWDDSANAFRKLLYSDLGGGGGAVSSVYGRSGAVVAAASDYDADQVDFTPAGSLVGTDVQAAIEELDFTQYTALGATPDAADYFPMWDDSASAFRLVTYAELGIGSGAVSSVYGRTGAVVAAASDYDADQVDFTPAGSLVGTDVQAAIEELDFTQYTSLAATPDDADVFTLWDDSASAFRKVTYANLMSGVTGAFVFKGVWDASAGTFPASADTGFTYIVSVDGTVDSIDFKVGDKIIARVDSASTTTYAANWFHDDNTDGTIDDLTAETASVSIQNDKLVFWDNSASEELKINIDDFFQFSMEDMFALTGAAAADDQLIILDASATQMKTVTPSQLVDLKSQNLVDGATVAFDTSSGAQGLLTSTNAATALSTPSNVEVGKFYVLRVEASGTDIVLSFAAEYIDAEGTNLAAKTIVDGESFQWHFYSPDGTNLVSLGSVSDSSDPYETTFDATADWGTASGGTYNQTITITEATHGKGAFPLVKVYDTTGSLYREIDADDMYFDSTGDVTVDLEVVESGDGRFAGSVVVSSR